LFIRLISTIQLIYLQMDIHLMDNVLKRMGYLLHTFRYSVRCFKGGNPYISKNYCIKKCTYFHKCSFVIIYMTYHFVSKIYDLNSSSSENLQRLKHITQKQIVEMSCMEILVFQGCQGHFDIKEPNCICPIKD
jgi:hypothetical protein